MKMGRIAARWFSAGLIITAAISGFPFAAYLSVEAMAAGSVQDEALPAQVNREGQVIVKVTPLALSPTADPWRFSVQFDTHATPLDQDLLQTAVLRGDNDKGEAPLGWQGDAPGGHHRTGVLVFKPIMPAPASVTLTLQQVGSVPERSFTWSLPKP
jgi:hypothetical protein